MANIVNVLASENSNQSMETPEINTFELRSMIEDGIPPDIKKKL